jgi:hypothetical protein
VVPESWLPVPCGCNDPACLYRIGSQTRNGRPTTGKEVQLAVYCGAASQAASARFAAPAHVMAVVPGFTSRSSSLAQILFWGIVLRLLLASANHLLPERVFKQFPQQVDVRGAQRGSPSLPTNAEVRRGANWGSLSIIKIAESIHSVEVVVRCSEVKGLQCLLAPLLALPITIADAATFPQLKGHWNCQEEGTKFSLEFKSPSSLIYGGETYQYELQDNLYLVSSGYGITPYIYQLQQGHLTILSPDGSYSHCTKGRAEPPVDQKRRIVRSGSSVAGQPLVPGQNWPVYGSPTGNISWSSSDPQALLYKFAGRWDSYSGSTLSNLYLKPDGSFEDTSESSYSGEFHDQGGFQTGAWGAVGQNEASGHWTIRGTLEKGIITLVSRNGQQRRINYQVHINNGEYYGGEYFFNGELYSVKYIYR